MDVSRPLFPFELVNIIHQVLDSEFVAVDLELSGIPTRPRGADGQARARGKARQTLQDHYTEARACARKFQILQLGLTIVEEAEDDSYILRPYNFYISPVPEGRLRFEREWTFSSSAVDFLVRHKFRFDKPYTDGVPYISRQEETDIRAAWAESDAARETMPDMDVKPQDQAFVGAVMQIITAWVNERADSRDSWVNIPPSSATTSSFPSGDKALNSWQRRMIHQIVRNDFPKLNVQSKNQGAFMQVQERDSRDDGRRKTTQEMWREKDLGYGVEFRWLIEALIGGDVSNLPLDYHKAVLTGKEYNTVTEKELRKKAEMLQKKVSEHRPILVGHNMFLDLVNLYQCFLGDLPESVDDFRAILRKDFSLVIDTKWLALFKTNSFDSTTLGDVEIALRKQEYPKIRVADGFDKYKDNEIYHEAGYDSYLTAVLALRLSTKRKVEDAENGVGLSLVAFGIAEGHTTSSEGTEDIFVTPPESVVGDVETPTSKASNVLSDPFLAVKNAFSKATARTAQSSEKASPIPADTISDTNKSDPIFTSPDETDQVRKSVAHTTISDLQFTRDNLNLNVRSAFNSIKKGRVQLSTKSKEKLPRNKTDRGSKMRGGNMFNSLLDLDDDMTSEAEEEGAEDDDPAVEIEKKVQQGILIPRFTDTRFWSVFGGRIRVNACEEGVFRLS